LVSSNTLDKFWDADEVVDEMLYANFRYELIERTQFNAGFYTPTSYPFLFAMLQEASSQS
jgi:capsule polysaccharide modification protein KpsS